MFLSVIAWRQTNTGDTPLLRKITKTWTACEMQIYLVLHLRRHRFDLVLSRVIDLHWDRMTGWSCEWLPKATQGKPGEDLLH